MFICSMFSVFVFRWFVVWFACCGMLVVLVCGCLVVVAGPGFSSTSPAWSRVANFIPARSRGRPAEKTAVLGPPFEGQGIVAPLCPFGAPQPRAGRSLPNGIDTPTRRPYNVSTQATSPDLSLASPDLAHRSKWSVISALHSDHLPILIQHTLHRPFTPPPNVHSPTLTEQTGPPSQTT